MAGDPIRDYFSLAPASASTYFRYSSSSSGRQRPAAPQSVRAHRQQRPAASSNGIHHPPRARCTGPATAPQYAEILSANSQYRWPLRGQVTSSAESPIDLTRSRQSSSTSASAVVPNRHRDQHQQEWGFGATHIADSGPTELSELLKSSNHAISTSNALAQQQLQSSGTATSVNNATYLARLVESSTHAASTYSAPMQQQQQLVGSGATAASVNNLTDLARFLKPSAITHNGISPPWQVSGVTATSIYNPIDLTLSLRSNNPAATALCHRLRNAKFKSSDGLCVIQDCAKRVRSRGLCKLHGGGMRCTVDGCTRASLSGRLCIRHGGGVRCSQEGCDKAAQSNERCKAHGGGTRCQAEGCVKSSQGKTGLCRQHGGGPWCAHEGCEKGAQRDGLCSTHGGTRYCQHRDCAKVDRGGGFCAKHGGGKRCEAPSCSNSARMKGKCPYHHLRLEKAAAKGSRASSVLPPVDQTTPSADSHEAMPANQRSSDEEVTDT